MSNKAPTNFKSLFFSSRCLSLKATGAAGFSSSRFLSIQILMVFLLATTACVGGGASSSKGVPFVESPVADEGVFEPTTGDDPYTAPGEECQSLDTVSLSPTSIGFGLSEQGDVQCQTIAVNPCVTFSAEVDHGSATTSQFVLYNQDQVEVTGRLSDQQETLSVCYKRTEVGSHSARVNVVIGSASATYAYVVPLTGSTVEPLFNISTPTEGQLVWEQDGLSTYDSTKSVFKIPASGTINSALSSIFTSTDMTIKVGESSQTLDVSGYTFSTTLEIPDTPAVYPVEFTMQTTQGPLTKTVNVIRYSRPEASLQIRDVAGGLVSAVSPESASTTSSGLLTAGILVRNLDVSGPRSAYPVRIQLSLTRPDGTVLNYNPKLEKDNKWIDSGTAVDDILFYAAEFPFGEEGENGACTDAFDDRGITYCVPMPPTAELGRGANILKATLCNDYTTYEGACVSVTTSIVADNDVPIINITAPKENSYYDIYGQAGKSVMLTGQLQNFVLTTSETVDGTTKTTCKVKVWLNTSTTQAPLEICDVITVTSAESSETTTGNQGNIQKASFSLPLTFDGNSEGFHKLTLYTNLVYIEVVDANGHTAYLTRSFQIGSLNQSTVRSNGAGTSTITSGQLGDVSTLTGVTEKAPIMLHVNSETLDGSNTSSRNLIKALEKGLNDNVKFADLVQGYTPNDEGEIPADVEPNSHLTGLPKLMQWLADGRSDSTPNVIENFKPSQTDNACGYNTPGTCAAIMFIKNLDDPRLFGSDVNKEEFWSPVVFGKRNSSGQLLDRSGRTIETKANGYPKKESDIEKIAPNYDFDDVQQGKFKVDKLEMKNDGLLTAHITLHGFKGHAVAFTTCEYGAMSFPPAIPIIFNIKELKLRLDDVQLKKIQLKEDGTEYFTSETDKYGNPVPENRPCSSGRCTNKLIIDESKLVVNDGSASSQSVYMSASEECTDYEVGSMGSSNSTYKPFGCDLHEDFVEAGFDENYWMLLETRNELDYLTNNPGPSLLVLFQEVLRDTFKDMLSCDIPKTMVNPLFDPLAFPYPEWMPENLKVESLKLAVDNAADGVTVALAEDAENPAFTFDLNLKESDLLIDESGLTIKLPFALGATGVSSTSISSAMKGRFPFDSMKTSPAIKSATRNNGYMYREAGDAEALENLSHIKMESDQPHLGVSLGLEEVANSALHILLKKGLKDVVELIDKDVAQDLAMQTSDTIGLDKVILGNFDICNQVDILSTDLPPSFLISDISQYAQGSALHLDLNLDKKSPPTLALLPVDGDDSVSKIQLGISNLQIDLKNLLKEDDGTYSIGDSIVKLRLDMILTLTMKYSPDTRRFELYISTLEETPLYISVIDRGYTYDDNLVIKSIRDTVLPPLWGNFSALYTVGGDNNNPVLAVNIPDNMVALGDVETVTSADAKEDLLSEGFTGMIVENYIKSGGVGSCEDSGTTPPEYYSKSGRGKGKVSRGMMETILSNLGAISPRDAVQNRDDSETSSTESEEESGEEGEVVDCGGHPMYTENAIVEALCPVGIADIGFASATPQIHFDTKNGYVHLSAGLLVEIYDWLNDDVEVD